MPTIGNPAGFHIYKIQNENQNTITKIYERWTLSQHKICTFKSIYELRAQEKKYISM